MSLPFNIAVMNSSQPVTVTLATPPGLGCLLPNPPRSLQAILTCQAGGTTLRYKDFDGTVYNEIFTPKDPVAYYNKWAPTLFASLYSGMFQYPGIPPVPRITSLPVLFPFTDSLRIRVWDSNVFHPPGQPMNAFGLDFVDEKGEPQAVGKKVTIIIGPRTPGDPEVEGDITFSMDDMGVEDPSHSSNLTPWRYGIAPGKEYKFVHEGGEEKIYCFPAKLLEDAESQSSTA
ncbi:hypothetical protein F5146DRAFT_1139493 [Armillaria mellea]|nr:hypothetical protein F5146DRAFT_1139493 [Armillaria mellea]